MPVGLEGEKINNSIRLSYFKEGIVNQLWNRTDYTMEQYKEFINEPKHFHGKEARMFTHGFFEFFSKTPWWMTPLTFLPVMAYCLFATHYYFPEAQWQISLALFGAGFVYASLVEYLLHRFLFHGEDYWLPEKAGFMAFHFMIHGIHHAFP